MQVEHLDLIRNLFKISSLLLAIPLGLGLYKRRELSFEQRVILGIVILTIVNDGLTLYLQSQGRNNLWVFHLFVPLLFVLVTTIYKRSLSKVFSEKLFLFVQVGFVLFSLVNSAFLEPIGTFNSNAIALASTIYIVLTILFFYRLLVESKEERPEKAPEVWFSMGLLIYHSGALFLFLFIQKIVDEPLSLQAASWILNLIFTVIIIGCYTVSICLKPQR